MRSESMRVRSFASMFVIAMMTLAGSASAQTYTAGQIAKFLTTGSSTVTSSVITENSSGYIGLGDTNPGTRLWVNGEATVTGSSGDLRFAPRNGSGVTMFFYNPNGTDLRLSGYFPDLVTFLKTGNVGFGVTNPMAQISVSGGVGVGQQIGLLGNAGSSNPKPGLFFGTNSSFNGTGATAYFGFTAALQGLDSQGRQQSNDFGVVGSSDPNLQRRFRIGYNTADDPSQQYNSRVDINTYTGDMATAGSITASGSVTATGGLLLGGGVGPAQKFGVLGSAGSNYSKPGLFLGSNTTLNGSGASAYFGFTAALQGLDSQGRQQSNDFGIVGSSDSNLQRRLRIGFNTADDPSQQFNSRVDINTYTGDIATSGTLTVTGGITTNGSITAAGPITGATVINAIFQDVAEWVPAADNALEPGTVVVVDPDKGNGVMASSEAYDTTVAGVVSAHPGIVLGKPGDKKAQVATTGRVKVKVDASKGAIRVGDLLVTSDVAGTAMKSEPMVVNGRRFHQPGTIIGKALEPLPSGTGEILVLLSLQ